MKTKIITLLTALAISSVSMAQIINVPGDQPSIQAGIDAAADGDTVLVDTGTWYENITFNGKAITVASNYIMQGDTNFINNTVIDGSQPANPDNGSVVTFGTGEDSTSVICGFTITGGAGTSLFNDTRRLGGGIMCLNAGAKIINNKILYNTSNHTNKAYGGGIGIDSPNEWVVLCDNTIQGNVSSSDNNARGGGVYSSQNYLIIKNNIIRHDSLCGDIVYGGGVYVYHMKYLEIAGNIITQNGVDYITSYWGVGVTCSSPFGPVKICQNEFSYNVGNSQGNGGGGGLYIVNTFDYPVEIDRNRFLYNITRYGGGLYEVSCYNMRVTNNIFISNYGSNAGAIGIYNMYPSSGEYQSQFINNTFCNNSADDAFGGAITYWADFASSPVIINCIFWKNAGPSFWEEITNYSNDTVFVFNSDINIDAIYGPWYGEYNFNADPELEADSIHLSASSPCIGTGIDSLEINGITYFCPDHDIDGDPRPLNGGVDVGADERNTNNQAINMSVGYQFISTRIIAEDPDMTIVMTDVLNDNLDFVRNSQGQTLLKIGPNWVNGIGDWIVDEGYLVKMFAADSFTINGTLVDPATPIPVTTGFQFVSYFPETSMYALLAFETIIGDDLHFIRNSNGEMIRKIGPNWVNGIGDALPTEGYLVKMFAGGEIIYPVAAKSSGKITAVPKHFTFEGGNAADPVYTIYIAGLEIGDEVAVYDGDIMVGAMKVNSQNTFDNPLPVFRTLNSSRGYKAGNPVILKVWDTSSQSLITFDYTMLNPYNEAYMENIYPNKDGLYSIIKITKGEINIVNTKESISIYPNPSEGIFNISIEGVSGKVQIKVFDVHGNEYRYFEIEDSNNLINDKLDLKELAAGVYFISFSGEDFSEVRKVLVQ